MKRSQRRDQVINDYIKIGGGLSGPSMVKAWLSHWHDMHPKLTFEYQYVRIYEKSVSAWGEEIKMADPLFFQKLSSIIAANATRRRRKK